MSDEPESPTTEESSTPTPSNESGGGGVDWRGAAVLGLLLVGLCGLVNCVLTWFGVFHGDPQLGLVASAIAFGVIVGVGFRR